MVHQQNTSSSMELSLQFNVSTGSTPQCTSSSCQHTFNETSSQVQQYTVTVAARNVVGVETANTSVIVGM